MLALHSLARRCTAELLCNVASSAVLHARTHGAIAQLSQQRVVRDNPVWLVPLVVPHGAAPCSSTCQKTTFLTHDVRIFCKKPVNKKHVFYTAPDNPLCGFCRVLPKFFGKNAAYALCCTSCCNVVAQLATLRSSFALSRETRLTTSAQHVRNSHSSHATASLSSFLSPSRQMLNESVRNIFDSCESSSFCLASTRLTKSELLILRINLHFSILILRVTVELLLHFVRTRRRRNI